MESSHVEVKELLQSAQSIFKKFKDKVNMKNYRKVLSAISVEPEDDLELEQYFRVVDTDEDGYVSYADFEESILRPLMEADQEQDDQNMEDDSFPVPSLLTLEKLNEFKNMFEYHKKVDTANLREMRDDIINNYKGFSIKLSEFDYFFKPYEDHKSVKEEEFIDLYNYFEQKVLEKAAVFDIEDSGHQKDVDVQMVDNENPDPQTLEEVVISDSDDSDMGDEEKDPEAIIRKIFEDSRKEGAHKQMPVEKVIKIFYKIKTIYDDKADQLKDKNTAYKNKIDVVKNEKEYFKNKVEDLKKKNDELKEANYNLKCDVEDLMKFEADFQRMMKQNQEKDDDIMKLEDEVEKMKSDMYAMQKQFQR